ncbi:MAG: Crp/Fnr family transcriptional regulator [Chitinophagaceae bacterium]|nr:MAG: Crp/Fnr family transcriptional regulator [Chitinophagaceae bacterium]
MDDSNIDSEKWKAYGGVSPLVMVFQQIHPLPDEMVRLVNEQTYIVEVKKNKFVISPVTRNENMFLIIKGVVRGFMKDEGQEITTWLNIENDVIGSIRNLFSADYPPEYVQALEDVTLVCIPHSLTQYLYNNFNEANFIGRRVTEMYYQATEERAYIGRIMSAEKRYLRFLKTEGALLERLPLKYIASYLSMRLETLVRIRTKLAKQEAG